MAWLPDCLSYMKKCGVLTFANHFITLESVVDKSEMTRQRDDHKEYVVDFLSGHVDKNRQTKTVQEIPFCIAGIEYEKELPTTNDWVKTLWITCIDYCSDETHPLLTFYARHRKRMIAIGTGAVSV